MDASKKPKNPAYDAGAFTEEKRKVRIRTLDGTDVKGDVFLEGTSFDRRVSNLLNDNRAFVSVTNAELFVNGRRVSTSEFVCINKQAISYVVEEYPA
jgi:hypothetical protein